MADPSSPLSTAQDTERLHPTRYRRRRHRRSTARRHVGPVRPGRFFKVLRHLHWLRLDIKPLYLGEADWILYRRRFNPYRAGSYKAIAYERGFVASKAALPKPSWPAL